MTEETETEDGENERDSIAESRVSITDSNETDDEDNEWVPAPERTPRPLKSKTRRSFDTTSSHSPLSVDAGAGKFKSTRVTKLAEELNDLSIMSEDSIDLLSPKKKNRRKQDQEEHRLPRKKRYVSLLLSRIVLTIPWSSQPSKKVVVGKGMLDQQVAQNGEGRRMRSRKVLKC